MNVNINIEPAKNLTALKKANEKFENISKKLLKPIERQLIEYTSDIFDINRLGILFDILQTDYGFTPEQLNSLYKKADEIGNKTFKTDLYSFYKINKQCQRLKEKGVDIEKLYNGG